MLYIENGEWALCPYIVVYKQNSKTLERHTHNKTWWESFAAKWDHAQIVEFKDAAYSGDQRKRLAEVQDISEGFEYYASRYVLEGLFPDELEEEEQQKHHPFKTLQLEKENERQGQAATEMQIESARQGQKQSDFEIRLLSLEGK